jgi:hypothetical protein
MSDEYVGSAPKTEIVNGMFVVTTPTGTIVLPISVARCIVEKAMRQLDQFDRESAGRIAPICKGCCGKH